MNSKRHRDRPPDSHALGDQIRRAREELGKSRQQLAPEVNYSVGNLRKFEEGTSLPPLQRLPAMCRVLDLDLTETLLLWLEGQLDNATETFPLRELLRRFRTPVPVPPQISGRHEARALRDAIADCLVDLPTMELITEFIRLTAEYRKRLTASEHPASELRIKDLPPEGELDTVPWGSSFDHAEFTHVSQRAIGFSRVGLGYYTGFVRIAPGAGAFHQHLESRYLDAGMEFFSVLRGRGIGAFQKPRNPSRWKLAELRPGTSGMYRGERGHAFVNDGEDDLVLFMVTVPYPPALSPEAARNPRGAGYAAGIEFMIDRLMESELPAELRTALMDGLATRKEQDDPELQIFVKDLADAQLFLELKKRLGTSDDQEFLHELLHRVDLTLGEPPTDAKG